jgi:hypothetical protein
MTSTSLLATCGPAGEPEHDGVYDDYLAFVAALSCGDEGKKLRRRNARAFLAVHPDLDAWMRRPTPQRLVDVRRADAWPLLSWCFVEGRLRADVDLLAAKGFGHHFVAWARAHPDEVVRARQVAADLGWGEAWTHRVCEVALALICLTQAVEMEQLSEEIFARFAPRPDSAPQPPLRGTPDRLPARPDRSGPAAGLPASGHQPRPGRRHPPATPA